MKNFIKIVLLTFTIIALACKPQKHGKGGSQQPKKGPMPCPIKDC